MSASAEGYFEAYVNQMAQRLTAADKALMRALTASVKSVVESSQVQWAGSQRKGTAIEGSDLDVCVESRDPVTEAQRRALRTTLQRDLGRDAQILSHAIRLRATTATPKVDVAFANAAFGSRPLPDTTGFHHNASRQIAARALKTWTRSGGLPWVSGWAVEALVVHLDHAPGSLSGLALFLRLLEWLEGKATPEAVEGVLRPAAFPRWNDTWSERLPGRLQALSNNATALLRRSPGPEDWGSPEDVGVWLGR